MSAHDEIPLDVLLDDDGHLTELALSVLGDGEGALLPESVRAHAEACAACCQSMGEAALLAEAFGGALREAQGARVVDVAPARVSSHVSTRVAARFPGVMVAAALAIAAIGLLPSLYSSRAWLASASASLTRAAPVVAKSGYLILKGGFGQLGPLAFLAPIASAMVLMALGLVLAKRFPLVAMAERGV